MALDKRPKRSSGDVDPSSSRKKAKSIPSEHTEARAAPAFTSNLASEETDFPRGGGTNLTAFELKQVREEGRREADAEAAAETSTKPKKRWQDSEREKRRAAKNKVFTKKDVDPDLIRVDQLNYKRLVAGTHILVRVHTILPLHLIVSLPNNLLGYVPITEISSTLTALLKADEEAPSEIEEEDEEEESDAPDLDQLFAPGQYYPAKITATFPTASQSFVSHYPPSETTRLAARVELTLVPEKVNADVDVKDVDKGYMIVGEVRDEEDKGWRVGLGLSREETSTGVEGWIPHAAAKGADLKRGGLILATVTGNAAGGRVLNLSLNQEEIKSAQLAEVSTVGSILPGHQVSALVTAVTDSGLNVKIGGFYDGIIDLAHLNLGGASVEDKFKLGKKLRARILYDNLSTTPRRFGLSILAHILNLGSPLSNDGKLPLEHAVAIGTKLEQITVSRVIPEWGLICKTSEALEGFVHISHIADQRVPALSHGTGEYAVGTSHPARVIGHSPLDGVLLLSTEKTVIDRVFTSVDELHIGQQLKGKIKQLTDKALFVDIGGSVDGVVWPTHYADIRLKHPEKRFRPGNTVRARVLKLEPGRNRVVLTLKRTLIDSEKPTPSHISEVTVGQVLDGVVMRIMDNGCIVELFGGIRTFVPIAEVSETYVATIASVLFVGQPVAIRIINLRPDNDVPVASIKQASAGAVVTAIFDGKVGDPVSGEVKEVHQDQVVVSLLPSGATALLSLSNLSNHRSMSIEELRGALHEGDAIDDLVVVAKNDSTGLVIVSNKTRQEPKTVLQKSGVSSSAATLDSLQVGSIVPGRIIAVNPRVGATIQLDNGLRGKLSPHDMVDDLDQHASTSLETGQEMQCFVLAINKKHRIIDLSTRPSRVGGSKKTKVVDPEIDGADSLKAGQPIRGIVKNIAPSGLYVTLGRNVDARIKIRELFDDFVKDWEARFEIGQIVEGKILSVDTAKHQVEMTLRTQERPQKASVAGLTDFEVGQKVDAEVKQIEAYGIFLQIHGSNARGLCHKSEISDQKVQNVEKLLRRFREGDNVKAKILSIDKEKGRINFGIKPSYFTMADINGDVDMDGEEDEEEEEGEEEEEEEEEDDDNEVGGDFEAEHDEAEDEDIDDEDDEEDEEEDEEQGSVSDEDENYSDEEIIFDPPAAASEPRSSKAKAKTAPSAATLQLTSGFNWSARSPSPDASTSDSSDSEDETPATAKGKSKAKPQSFDLTGSAPEAQPSSTAEFERALLSSPNSSFLWIQYMSFLLQLHEIDAARKIGRKALEKIAYREETEKLNVWMALLNLEIGFGSEQEAEKIFKEAAQYNDARTVYLRYAEALAAAGKDQLVEEVYQKCIKKFSQHLDSWIKLAEYYLKKGNTDAARALLPRAMQSLDGSKHVEMIQRMAVLEFRYGDAERGKTLFEGLMDRYKKRLDLWSVYIDQVAKTGEIGVVRGLFERALDQHLTSKKAKFLFKKWLATETGIGDVAGQETAKEKAREWVAQNTKPAESDQEEDGDDE